MYSPRSPISSFDDSGLKSCTRFKYFLVFFFSIVSLIILSTSLGTPKWIVSKPIRILRINGSENFNITGELQQALQDQDGISKFQGQVNFGLFRGTKILNYGFGNRISELTVQSEGYPISFSLWLTTIVTIAFSMLFAFIGGLFALFNFFKGPRRSLIGPLSLIVWNASIALLLPTTLIYWMIEYFDRLQRNIMTHEETQNGWTSDGRSQFGYSYHLVAITLVISLVNIFIVSLAHFDAWGYEENAANTRQEHRQNCEGVIMLY